LHILSVRNQIDYLLDHPKAAPFPHNKQVADVAAKQVSDADEVEVDAVEVKQLLLLHLAALAEDDVVNEVEVDVVEVKQQPPQHRQIIP